ncbi:unnamed protein product [Rangifer tarandus platyrhynchus]|uniref:Uncharacterized protein n=1 Tax=Rangifer tarandus platyrhynchus TaxID=3082113 RepID=A0ABN8Y500_RANTA|nr:unnamed protein product [Rangifer tarandus platyrhynchus]
MPSQGLARPRVCTGSLDLGEPVLWFGLLRADLEHPPLTLKAALQREEAAREGEARGADPPRPGPTRPDPGQRSVTLCRSSCLLTADHRNLSGGIREPRGHWDELRWFLRVRLHMSPQDHVPEKGHGGIDAASGAGPHMGSLDGPARVGPGEGAIKRGRSHSGGLRGDAGSQALRACCLPAPPDKPRGMAPAAFHTEGERAGTLFSPHVPVEAAGERGQEGEECLKHNQNPKPTFTGPTVRPPPGPSGPCPCRHRSAKPGCRLARAPNTMLLRPVPCQARLQVLYASCCAHPPPFSIHCAVNGHWRCVQSGASDTDAAVVCRAPLFLMRLLRSDGPGPGLTPHGRSASLGLSFRNPAGPLGPGHARLFGPPVAALRIQAPKGPHRPEHKQASRLTSSLGGTAGGARACSHLQNRPRAADNTAAEAAQQLKPRFPFKKEKDRGPYCPPRWLQGHVILDVAVALDTPRPPPPPGSLPQGRTIHLAISSSVSLPAVITEQDKPAENAGTVPAHPSARCYVTGALGLADQPDGTSGASEALLRQAPFQTLPAALTRDSQNPAEGFKLIPTSQTRKDREAVGGSSPGQGRPHTAVSSRQRM